MVPPELGQVQEGLRQVLQEGHLLGLAPRSVDSPKEKLREAGSSHLKNQMAVFKAMRASLEALIETDPEKVFKVALETDTDHREQARTAAPSRAHC